MKYGTRFGKGDRVRVIFVMPSGEEQVMRAEYMAGPGGSGDTFKFWNESGPFEVNGNGPTFNGIYPDPTKEGADDE